MKCSSSQNVRTHLDQAQLVCSRAVSVAALDSERATLGSEVRVRSVAWEFCLPCLTWFSSFCSLDKEWIDFSSYQIMVCFWWFLSWSCLSVYLSICIFIFFDYAVWLVKAQSPNHWTSREFPRSYSWEHKSGQKRGWWARQHQGGR